MSAPPRPGGPPANGAPRAPMIRRVQNSDPMRARQKPRAKPAHSLPPKRDDNGPSKQDLLDKEIEVDFAGKIKNLEQQRVKNGGWSDQPAENIHEYPLVITKKSLLEGIRHHVMRLHRLKGDEDVDVTNQDQFPRPVTLHRRDPRLPPAHRMVVKEESAPLDPADAAEQERISQAKAEKEAQRALDQAQIAPSTREANPKPNKQNNKKDKATAFYGKHSDAHKKQSGIRYEETLPWHLEDAEGRAGTWVGSYVAGLSDTNVGLVIDGARFRMIPLERWYRFDEKPRFDTMSLDAAEKLMYEVKDVKRWVMKDKDREAIEKEKAETRRFLSGPTRVKTESETSRAARRGERQDDFELDMSGDEFQDDDETPGFEADDEDTKTTKDRLRREQKGANLFGEGEEDKVEQEEKEKELEKLRLKTIGKQTIKKLTKYEQAMEYEDDSSDENNPFTDSSDSEDSDEEVKMEEAEEEKKPQVPSGANTKGNTTPSKNASKKGKLKRPGSPVMSESSDNENARKKIKTSKGSSVVPSRGSTPIPGRPKVLGGATSDGEATGGEGSDGGGLLKKKLKLKAAAAQVRPGGTPLGSRAGSPAPAPGQASASSSFNNGSKASPPPGGSSASPPPSAAGGERVTAADVVATLARYPAGISLGNLIRLFSGRVDTPGHLSKKEWISLVKANALFGPDKLLRPKHGPTSPGP
ncbi:putative transcription initiation factor IIF subunit alpha [Podospora fimiseda]|uniref:Transcription initiation factor IIF subunit alpha n=1 Tax=Podospora fimiseda TaxID=252190 RepID=A0AAN7H4Z0_9PEZI|nr:putative transcription initiation factor IIF subunit alpha [Podospora fimiseda]